MAPFACDTSHLAAVAIALIACTKPFPTEKAGYVGEWHGIATALLITQDGNVACRRLHKGVDTSIDAPLKAFQGDDFVVGVGPVTTTFVVTVPPHQDGGVWKTPVDGVKPTRKR